MDRRCQLWAIVVAALHLRLLRLPQPHQPTPLPRFRLSLILSQLSQSRLIKLPRSRLRNAVEVKAEEANELPAAVVKEDLVAHFVRDAVADGTVISANTVFEQTWYLRNGGNSAWPAGCTVKFVGGDNMCAVDPDHPASVHELVSAAESTTCYTEVAPGQEAGFTVLMRTPKPRW